VNQAQATSLAKRLQAEHPNPSRVRFLPRRTDDGSWSVCTVLIPPALRSRPLKATVEIRPPRPPMPGDVRSGHEMRAPGLPGGVAG